VDLPMPVPAADSVLTPLPSTGTDGGAAESVGLPRAQDLTMAGTSSAAAGSPFEDAPSASAAPPAEAAMPAASDVTALTAKIDSLQSALDSQSAKVKDLESTVQQLERALESRATAAPAAAKKAAPRRKAASSVSRDSNAAYKPPATTVRWVLKSAQPGHAMVARAGEHEMRSVTVGDTLPGVGRVTQIYQSPTGWVVQGTDGRILQ
jgi:intracellular multiplication protein IcmG